MAFWKRSSGKLLAIRPEAVSSIEEQDNGFVDVAMANGRVHRLTKVEADALADLLEVHGPVCEKASTATLPQPVATDQPWVDPLVGPTHGVTKPA
jgi:RPA family protein